VQVAKVRFGPEVLDTVALSVPRQMYARDGCVELSLRRLSGDYAVLAGLKLYECFPYKNKPGDECVGVTLGRARGEESFEVSQPLPDLFRSSTRITYTASRPCPVDIDVFDIQGRHVRRLASGLRASGTSVASWNGLDDAGLQVPAGAYLIRIRSEGRTESRKVVLTR